MATLAAPPKTPRRKLVRRASPDRSQALRHAVQAVFLAINVWIGVEFYLFVRYYETGGRSLRATRPPGVEGWLPIASLMNLKVLLLTGHMPAMHAAGMFLLIAFLAASWIFRKSFCGWLCPVGTLSEYLWRLATFAQLPPSPVAGYHTAQPEIHPPGTLSLRRHIHVGSRYPRLSRRPIRHCRRREDAELLPLSRPDWRDRRRRDRARVRARPEFLVPLPLPIRRPDGPRRACQPAAHSSRHRLCIDCGKCAKACPSALPVDRLVTIRSAECTACLQCVAECPAAGALFLSAPRAKRVPAWVVAAGAVTLFAGVYVYAQATGHWHTDLPARLYFELIPHANEFAHP